MTAHNGNTEQDERGLLPYSVIIAATKGDPEAIQRCLLWIQLIVLAIVPLSLSRCSKKKVPRP